jgi:uncharacterized protein (DUF2225 family)/anti-anti-sigma regulatory factor
MERSKSLYRLRQQSYNRIMPFERQYRGHYLCYDIGREFSTTQVLKVKTFLLDEIKDTNYDFAFDLGALRLIDSSGLTFFKNIDELLRKNNRHLAFYGGPPEIQKQLADFHSFTLFASLVDFERDFHEINPQLNRTILNLAKGKGPMRPLKMICPLCGFDNVAGFIIDDTQFQLAWSDSEIVPLYDPITPDVNALDFSAYQVAVCPRCFYAGTRLDWFTIAFPEGVLESRLSKMQIGNLSNSAALRRNLAMSYEGATENAFFQMPRESRASYLSWKLNEFNLKHMHAERKVTDGFEIVVSNFMMCKYSQNEREIDDHMHTALAWLYNILENKANYSTLRLAKAYTYLISVLIAQDKTKEAKSFYKDFVNAFGDIPDCLFWLGRARDLIFDG